MSIQWLGFAGTGLVVAAYVSQVAHLLRTRCTGGVSLSAYLGWSLAATLLLVYAIVSGNTVFIVLQSYQLLALTSISLLSVLHRGSPCDTHCGTPPQSSPLGS